MHLSGQNILIELGKLHRKPRRNLVSSTERVQLTLALSDADALGID